MLSHPAPAQFLDDAVVRNGLADHFLADHFLADHGLVDHGLADDSLPNDGGEAMLGMICQQVNALPGMVVMQFGAGLSRSAVDKPRGNR